MRSVLKVADVRQTSSGVAVGCIGCHTATPDGAFVGFTGSYPWPNALAGVEAGNTGAMPGFLGAAGVSTLTQDWHGIITFSGKHWTAGDHIAITSLSTEAVDPNASLVWMEIESGASGVLARRGDPAGAAAPNFSHDGTGIVYTSTNANQDGRMGVGTADLYTIPFADRAGGAATPVAGAARRRLRRVLPVVLARRPADRVQPPAPGGRQRDTDGRALRRRHVSEPGHRESGSCRAPAGTRSDCARTTRLRARRPSSRTRASIRTRQAGTTRGPSGRPRSAPPARACTTGSFSRRTATTSRRRAGSSTWPRSSCRSSRTDTYPAIYLWNQDLTTSNHTPAWDAFKIPHVD